MIISTGAALPVDGGFQNMLPRLGIVIHIRRNIELAKKNAIARGGIVSRFVARGADPEEVVYYNVTLVDKYLSDLSILERISHFEVENNGSIEEGVQKLIAVINKVNEKRKQQ